MNINPMSWLSEFFGFFRAFQFWIVIAPWELALRVRLGKNAKTLCPGIHWRIPFFDRIFIQPSRLRTITEDGISVTTADGKNLVVTLGINYAVGDIHKLFMTLSSPDLTIISRVSARTAEIASKAKLVELSPEILQKECEGTIDAEAHGLINVKVMVMSYSVAKAYRLLNSAYRNISAHGDIESAQPK